MRIAIASILSGLLVVSASAQSSTPQAAPIDTLHLKAMPSTSDVRVGPGGKVSLLVDVAPKARMHLYAPGEKDGIPVTLTIEPNEAFKTGAPQFPPPQKYFFEPLNLTQLVYSKPFTITVPITLGRAQPAADTLTVKGALRYQACDDKVCYLPKTVAVSWILLIR